MSNKRILHFIKENRELIKTASLEQKIKLLKLIRESMNSIKTKQNAESNSQTSQTLNSDYLEER